VAAIRANLGGLGLNPNIGAGATLAESWVSWPQPDNPDYGIAGGIRFPASAYATAWPGASISENVPTVWNTLYRQDMIPRGYFGGQENQPQADGATYASRTMGTSNQLLSPASLVAPLPSITGGGPGQITSDQASDPICQMSSWASHNPVVAVLAIGLTYYLLSRHRKGGG
jgi:hypothetical protein